MKTIPDFENELKAISPRLSIIQNPNRPGLANIKLDGVDVCPVPGEEIFDEPNPGYKYTFPNGFQSQHKSKGEALDMVRHRLQMVETPEGADRFFGRNEYA